VQIEPITGRYMRLDIHGRPHRLDWEEAGSGFPLLCLHTAGSDGRQYRALLNDPEITARFRVIVFDMPWHGKSSPPEGWEREEYKLTTDAYVELVVTVAQALELDRPVAMGCSIGGRVVLELARRHPDLFRAVIGLQSSAFVQRYFDISYLHKPTIHGGEACAAYCYGLVGPGAPQPHRWETLWPLRAQLECVAAQLPPQPAECAAEIVIEVLPDVGDHGLARGRVLCIQPCRGRFRIVAGRGVFETGQADVQLAERTRRRREVAEPPAVFAPHVALQLIGVCTQQAAQLAQTDAQLVQVLRVTGLPELPVRPARTFHIAQREQTNGDRCRQVKQRAAIRVVTSGALRRCSCFSGQRVGGDVGCATVLLDQTQRVLVLLEPRACLLRGFLAACLVGVVEQVCLLHGSCERMRDRPPHEVHVVLAVTAREGGDGVEHLVGEALGAELVECPRRAFDDVVQRCDLAWVVAAHTQHHAERVQDVWLTQPGRLAAMRLGRNRYGPFDSAQGHLLVRHRPVLDCISRASGKMARVVGQVG
jgi:pimeloyl-ACP methyl ester carboxylesterase